MPNQKAQKHSKTMGNTRFQISAPLPAPSTFPTFEGLRRYDLCRAAAFRLKMRYDLCLAAVEVLPQKPANRHFDLFCLRLLSQRPAPSSASYTTDKASKRIRTFST
jgi:hypothetical protein